MNVAIIVAGGKGSRFNSELPKQFVLVNNKPLMFYTLKVFNDCKEIDQIVLVCHSDYISQAKKIVNEHKLYKVTGIISGGDTRQASVYNGLKAIKTKDDDIVLIHDCARPLVSEEIIKNNIKACQSKGAVTTAIKVTDTTITGEQEKMNETLNRDELFSVQTPQTFKYHIIMEAHEKYKDQKGATDDAQLVRKMGREVTLVEGSKTNIKITTPDDLILFESIIMKKKA